MPGRRIVLAAALASAVLCPLGADALDAHILIARCAATTGANLQGLDDIRKACPGIDQVLAERYAGRPSSMLPAVSDLRAIAVGLQEPQAASSAVSVRDRVKAWLRRRLAPFAGMLQWFRSLPHGSAGPGLRATLLVGAGVLILVSLAVVIFTELQSAGLVGPGRRRRSGMRRHAARTRVVAVGGNAEDNLDTADALDRPASALRLLIEALRRSRRIERDGNLTCREVLARAVFDTQGQRDGFAGIALLAERELFGPGGSPIRVPEELRPALPALYSQLSAAPAARSAPS